MKSGIPDSVGTPIDGIWCSFQNLLQAVYIVSLHGGEYCAYSKLDALPKDEIQ
jgi:hypothetical protein